MIWIVAVSARVGRGSVVEWSSAVRELAVDRPVGDT